MDLQLKGKTAFISGSTAGIGLATAKSLVREGATVIINGRSQEGVNSAIKEIKEEIEYADIRGAAADFSKAEEVEALLKQVPDVDILINNAGIFEPKAFAEISDADWFRFFEVNVMSGVRLSRHYFQKMMERNWGRIIFVSSESGVLIPDEMIHYGVTKTAQLAVSRGMAELTKGTNVTVNAVLPGPTRSRGVSEFLSDLARADNISVAEVEKNFFKNMRPSSLIQRFASTQEIASMITYLVSPLASATNGAAIRVEGGLIRSAL